MLPHHKNRRRNIKNASVEIQALPVLSRLTTHVVLLCCGLTIGGISSYLLSVKITLIFGLLFLVAALLVWWLQRQMRQSPLVVRDVKQVASQQIEQAVYQERERIYRNLHDDIGAQLLSLVYQASDPRAADAARTALQNMRDAIAKTIDKRLTMHELLGDLRMEMEQRLDATGLVLHWDVPMDLADPPLKATVVIAISRIFREGLSNIIKHSGANSVSFSVRPESGKMLLCLSDNGAGNQSHRRGRGLNSMMQRAQAIGARLSAENRLDGGFEMRLIV